MLQLKVFHSGWRGVTASLAALVLATANLVAGVSVTNLFGDHMVLQRDAPVKVWGTASAGEEVEVDMAGRSAMTVADAGGTWSVELPAMPAGGPHSMVIRGDNELVLDDILVGEVWVASGQSNMQWTLDRSLNADLARLTAQRNGDIRFLRINNMGSQEPQEEIKGRWTRASTNSCGNFSAVAYAYAESLHASLGVPVGIIENSWGGSNAETWVPRDVIAADPVLVSIHEQWIDIERNYDLEAELAAWEVAVAEWEKKAEEARNSELDEPRKPRKPQDRMTAQHRPGNLWNARVLPIVRYPMRGVIWYQGEGNSGRGLEYRTLFPTLIREWRKAWGADFPFYFVQLADFKQESIFGPDENWPVLREAQTYTLRTVPNTGQAVIIDIGEGKDIHPRHKEEVGRRLARWALNRDYGFHTLTCRSPEFDTFNQQGDKLVVKFNYTGSGLRAFDTNDVQGFVIRTEDGNWIPVTGKVTSPDTVRLALPDDSAVTALRYAWADNPVCNLFSYEGLPATPFRSDMP
jgi:sialate O-acetylesterase